jgi:hypothetical protein
MLEDVVVAVATSTTREQRSATTLRIGWSSIIKWCARSCTESGRRCVMKLYSKPLFITTVVVIGMNVLIQAYLRDFGEVVAWSLLMLAEFRVKNLEKSLDDSTEREDRWYRIATGKPLKRKEKRDGER